MRRVGQECNGLVILESLAEGERPTAERLELSVRKAIDGHPRLDGLFVRRRQIRTREDLLGEFAAMQEACTSGRPHPLRPLLHLEMHGHEEGVRLEPSGELVPWKSVYDDFVNVNRATAGQLQVSLGVCSGAYIIDLINPPDPAPFWGALGATDAVWDSSVERFFTEYFAELFRGFDGTAAFDRAERCLSEDAGKFHYFSGRQIFHGAYTQLLAKSLTASGLDEMVDSALRGRDPQDPYAHLDIGRRLRAKDQLLPVFERNFRLERERFFMTGYEDDGTHRSGVEWEDVLEDALALVEPAD